MHILFVADPLESFKIYKDTSFAMMRELQKRGHSLSACEVTDIAWRQGQPVCAGVRDIVLTGDPQHAYEAVPCPRVPKRVTRR